MTRIADEQKSGIEEERKNLTNKKGTEKSHELKRNAKEEQKRGAQSKWESLKSGKMERKRNIIGSEKSEE